MKRFACFFLVFLLLATIAPMTCYAAETDGEKVVARFHDGSYITEKIVVNGMRYSKVRSGDKVRTYYGGDGSVAWKVTLSASFTYTGSSAICDSASCSVSIYNSAWYTISKSSDKSGNTAYGYATLGEKYLGVTVSKVPVSLSLSCDANGNLS